MITVTNVTKHYGERTVFDRFSAQITEGVCTVITGESGCGKTTLLRLIAGLELPNGGEVAGVPEKISAVFQENRLCEDYTALANVCMVTDRAEAKKMLSRMGLADSMKKPVRELSGGMQRRVAIARALCADYGLLLLDEPFQGLDPATKETVMQITKEETAGKTVLLVTHDSTEAAFFPGETLRL